MKRVAQYSLVLSRPSESSLVPAHPINRVFRTKLNQAVTLARRAAETAGDTTHAANATLLESNLTLDDFIQWVIQRELSAP
jgi:hypothetical protein